MQTLPEKEDEVAALRQPTMLSPMLHSTVSSGTTMESRSKHRELDTTLKN